MKSNVGIVSMVLVLNAATSLVTMIFLLKIDSMIHGDLLRYGLRFSYGWAMPYWTMTTIVFGMGWFNIIASVAFQFYLLVYARKEALESQIPGELEPQLKPTPVQEETRETEIKPVEDVEEYKEEVAEPMEEKTGMEPEPQTVTEDSSVPEPSETVQAEEVPETVEQEQELPESQVETEETSTATETEQKTPDKSEEEEPILIGMPEEEKPQTKDEETSQQTGTS